MSIASEDIYLEVPYSDKDKVKRLKARWDPSVTKWYIPRGFTIEPFDQWIVKPTDDNKTTLSAMLLSVSLAVAKALPMPQWCVAEIAEISVNRGNAYLALVELDPYGGVAAKVRANAFNAKYTQIRQKFVGNVGAELAAGMKVLLLLKPTVSPVYGMSFSIEDIDPNFTLGGVAQQIKALIDRLVSESLDKANSVHAMPRDFTHVAVISPGSAAGLGDFLRDTAPLEKAGLCRFSFFSALFQGEASSGEVCRAVQQAASLHETDPLDAIVIIRGGGAVTDLAWMNHYDIAKALALAPVPVFSGIGHERDETVVDIVARRRFGTPSKVSAFITQTVIQNALTAHQKIEALNISTQNAIASAAQHAHTQYQSLLSVAQNRIASSEGELARLKDNLTFKADKVCAAAIADLRVNLTTLITIDPAKMLGRGYAVVRENGHHVASKSQLTGRGVMDIEFQDGKLEVNYVN